MMRKKRILIVDDEVIFTKFVKIGLEATGRYEVMVKNTGAEAVQAFMDFNPDIIFLDIVMTDMEGSEVAYQIKKQTVFVDVPLVFLTGTISYEEASKMRGVVGGEYFMAKPVSIEQLVEFIEKHTENEHGA